MAAHQSDSSRWAWTFAKESVKEFGSGLWNAGKELVYRARDVLNDALYSSTTLLSGGRWWLGSSKSWSDLGQTLDSGDTTWGRATLSGLPGAGAYDAITGKSLLTGEQLSAWIAESPKSLAPGPCP